MAIEIHPSSAYRTLNLYFSNHIVLEIIERPQNIFLFLVTTYLWLIRLSAFLRYIYSWILLSLKLVLT